MVFINDLEKKVLKQLKSQRIAFLLGAGSSYLDGNGYPLMSHLWDAIKKNIPETEREDIQRKLNAGANGIENALDLLDDGGVNETSHRYYVTRAVAAHFSKLTPDLKFHSQFLKKCTQRANGGVVTIFSLNYDPLIERASEIEKIRVIDGFIGFEGAFFDAKVFQEDMVVIRRGLMRREYTLVHGIIRLYKLHGSVGWYMCSDNVPRRCIFNIIPEGTKHLMVPPQKRKSTETMTVPYVNLWSELRGMLRQGQRPMINRLFSVGYGMEDEHVNALLESALARTDFTLIILAKKLSDIAFSRWSPRSNVIIVTNERSSLNGVTGLGHHNLWSFERLSEEN